MKFIKDNCEIKKEQRWALCTNGSQGPQMDRIQRPFPNKETFRYKSVFEFPSTCLDRKTMSVDDFIPRAQIKKYFNEEKLNTAKSMEEFSCASVVSRELVKNYVDHLKYLKFSKDLRNNTTAEKQRNSVAKKYDAYNWDELALSGGLSSLHVF